MRDEYYSFDDDDRRRFIYGVLVAVGWDTQLHRIN